MINEEATIDFITQWLSDYSEKSRTNGFVVGISGGIDSAVVSTLCAKTGKKVIVLEMPIHQDSDQVSRGKKHINWLLDNYSNVSTLQLDLTASYDSIVNVLEETSGLGADEETKNLTLGNSRSRLRMLSLYAIAGIHGMLVCGTGNKIEDFGIGFFTKYGDGGVDLSPIADLMKSEVYSIGKVLGVTDTILGAKPTDGLWDDGRTDEDQIGATYDELEWAMKIHDEFGDQPTDSHFNTDREKEVWEIYIRRHKANKHKMDPIPICVIPEDLKKQ